MTFATKASSTFIIALVLTCLAGMPDDAGASTLTVTNLNDSGAGTLRQLVHDAAANDTIVFAFGGTITLTNGELLIGQNLTITGPAASSLTVSGNNASRVFNISAGTTFDLSNLIISSGNSPDKGGGIYNGGALTLNNCTITRNVTLTNGGGIFNDDDSVLSMNNCTVSANRAFHHGGGICYLNFSSYDRPITNDCNNCTVSDNIGDFDGGGIYAEGYSPLMMKNCTVAGNIAGTGGGIFDIDNSGIVDFPSLTMINCTISQNIADGNARGGGLSILREGDGSHDQVIFFNTIIAQNYTYYDDGYEDQDIDSAFFPIISLGHNFIGKAVGTEGWLGSDRTGDIPFEADAGLGPLQDNGGPTFTMAPSPFVSAYVVDAGDDAVLNAPYNLTTDQRGRPRRLRGTTYRLGSHVDIGAVEIGAVTLIVTNNNDSGPGSLRQVILDAFPYEDDTITFAPNVTGIIALSSGELLLNKSINIAGPGTTNLAISGNSASRVFDVTNATVNISGLTIRDGLVTGGTGAAGQPGRDNQGAGIFNHGVLSLADCQVLNNSVTGGRGGASSSGNGGQGGSGNGAGVANFNTLSLSNCYIHDNSANGGNGGNGGTHLPGSGGNGRGGGIYNVSNLAVSASTISSNTANSGGHGTGAGGEGFNGSGFGGGIASVSGVVSNNSSTIANNTAKGLGGGVYCSSASYSSVSCTISGNTANLDGNGNGGVGGGINCVAGTGTLADTVVAANFAAASPDLAGGFATGGYNLIGIDGGSLNGNYHDQKGTQALPLDPGLGPLADNGGPAPTMALLPGSPAIDQGNSFGLAADQRGRLRPYDFAGITNAIGGDGSDIGAYEFNASAIVANIADAGPGSLRQVVLDAIPGEVITFASGVTGVVELVAGELLINRYLTIAGPANASVTISGNHSNRVFHFNVGAYTDTMKLSNLTIANGSTTGPGAGIFNETGTALLLNNCTISGNNSGDSGGGIANNGLITLTNCTVSGNQAVAGGGLYNYCGTLNLWCCTVASNTAPTGGGFYNYPTVCSFAEISGTLIADNNASGAGPDVIGSFTSFGYNLIGKTNGLTGGLGGLNQLGSIAAPLDPKIGPLQDNSGPAFTHALLAGSPAIDQGNSLGVATDQRGRLRPYDFAGIPNVVGGDGSDIGAFEMNHPILNLARSANNVILSWFAGDPGYTLQTKTNLDPSVSWGTVSPAPVIFNGQNTVTNSLSGPQKFYRLNQ